MLGDYNVERYAAGAKAKVVGGKARRLCRAARVVIPDHTNAEWCRTLGECGIGIRGLGIRGLGIRGLGIRGLGICREYVYVARLGQ